MEKKGSANQKTLAYQPLYKDFPLADIKLLDEYYASLTQKDVDFLNTFNPDKLLYNFRLTAGWTKEEIQDGRFDYAKNGNIATSSYSGWENTRIGGHTLGHYLTAAAQAIAGGYGNCKGADGITLKKRVDYLLEGILDCQKKNDELCAKNQNRHKGFVFGATMADPQQPELQFDKVESTNASDTWVPWYTIHKLMNGFVETYKLTGKKAALEIAENLGEWIYERTDRWDENLKYRVLGIEYGGMNDCVYELYKCAVATSYADSEHFLQAAHKFDEERLFEKINSGTRDSDGSIKAGTDLLNNRHANTTIPKYMGALNRYITLQGKDGSDKYLEYVENFWDLVVNHHTYITGGNSECEHFGRDDVLDAERSNCNCETCNTHNMLKITRELFKITGNKKYADYYENTFLNAIMASVNGETGMTTYFQPMASGCFKNFCNPDVNKNYFWCCTGTGLENFTKLGDSFYFYDNGDNPTGSESTLVVNQFVSSSVYWEEKGVTLVQKSEIPQTDKTSFTILTDSAKGKASEASSSGKADGTNFTLMLRVPDWIAGEPTVKVNGKVMKVIATKTCVTSSSSDDSITFTDGYLKITRNWKNSDTVELSLPMNIVPYTLADNRGTVFAFKYGPVVLAAELGKDKAMTLRQVGVQCDVAANKIIFGKLMNLNGNYGGTSGLPTLEGETICTKGIPIEKFMQEINEHLVRVAGGKGDDDKSLNSADELKFELRDVSTLLSENEGSSSDKDDGDKPNKPLIFSPYYRLNDQRYGIYWLFSETQNNESGILEAKRAARDTRVYLDGIGVGYGAQTEGNTKTYPCMEEKGTGSVGDPNALTRYAKKDGSFSYLFQVEPGKKNYLVCGFLMEDDGKTICIKCGRTTIAEFTLDSAAQISKSAEAVIKAAGEKQSSTSSSEKYFMRFELPQKAVRAAKKFDGKNVIRITFSGRNDDESARIVSPAKTCTEYNHKAGIESLSVNGQKAEVLPNGNLKATAPKNAAFIKLKVKLSDENGLLYINDKLVDDSKEISIPVTTNPLLLGLKIYAEDQETAVEKSLLINAQ